MVLVSGEEFIDFVFNFLCNVEVDLYKKEKSIDLDVLKEELKKELYILKNEDKGEAPRVILNLLDAAIEKFGMFKAFLYINETVEGLSLATHCYIRERRLENTEVEKYILDALDKYKEFKGENKHGYKI